MSKHTMFFALLLISSVLILISTTACAPISTPTSTPTATPPSEIPTPTPTPTPTEATVKFVMNLEGAGEDVSYTYKIGETISSSDIPKMKSVKTNAFNCWTSDERGLVPCNPENYVVTQDITFYASWYSRSNAYASDTTLIELRDGGVYSLPQGGVIFYGASNFTRWKTLQDDMKPMDALNHGIGGATDPDLLNHLDRLVLRYNPSVVVIQCSNNDVVKFGDAQCKRTKEELYNRIHEALPNTTVVFVCHMPLPSRTAFWKTSTRLQDLNVWVKEFCDTHDNCEYLDVWDNILEIANVYLSGKTSMYFADSSHFNSAGQAKFCEALKPRILEILSNK